MELSIEYLNDERLKIWDRIEKLERNIKKKSSDFENDARESAQSAHNHFEQACLILKDIQKVYESAQNLENENTDLRQKLADHNTSLSESISKVEAILESLEGISESADEKFGTIETIYSELNGKKILVDSVTKNAESIEELFVKVKDYAIKADTNLKAITSKKEKIDEIDYEIFGYDDVDDDGKEIFVEGLKDKLTKSYDDLEKKLSETTHKLQTDYSGLISNFEKHKSEYKAAYEKLLADWNKEFLDLKNKIEELLPKALTAGLSYAYNEKRLLEEKDSKTYLATFRFSIGLMCFISLIPVAVSFYTFYHGYKFEEVIQNVPKMVSGIIPLYIPILWIGYFANKRLNLSKRLIEEYSHKEVLSKTFEGLSKQINSLDNIDITNDLKVKLLYNILEVSSENPGKLIKDYNKSDHPVMDAIDKSIKLTNAVEKLARLPGFNAIATKLADKTTKVLNEQDKKAHLAIDEE